MCEKLFDDIRALVPMYNRTREDNDDLATEIYLQFQLGGGKDGSYEEILKQARRLPFLRKFVQLRCMRVWTDQKRWDAKHAPSFCEEELERSESPDELVIEVETQEQTPGIMRRLLDACNARDRELLDLLSRGLSRRQTAEKLGCSVGQVQNRVAEVRRLPELEELRELLW